MPTAAGTTRLLIHMHGDGPGTSWALTAQAGEHCQFYGPRRSLDFGDLTAPLVLVGDETSFALAAALHESLTEAPPLATLFEVTDPEESLDVLTANGVPSADLVRKAPDDDHIRDLSDALIALLSNHPGTPLCLTSRAQTIAALRRTLKSTGLGDRNTKVNAYWGVNRSGLD